MAATEYTHEELEDGTIVVYPKEEPAPLENRVLNAPHFANLAEFYDETALDELGNFLRERVESDLDSRNQWEREVKRALQLLGMGPESMPDQVDDENADNSEHPLLLQAMIRFQSNALNEMLPPDKVCVAKPRPIPEDTPPEERQAMEEELAAAAKRVEEFISDYLLNRLPTYVPDHDRVLHDTSLAGSGFKKVFVDDSLPDPVQVEMVAVEDLIISYDAASMVSGRVTHRIKMPASELVSLIERGYYIDTIANTSTPDDLVTEQKDKIQGLQQPSLTERSMYTLYEVHTELLLDADNAPGERRSKPYVVTVDAETGRVLAIRRNWKPNDPHRRRIEAFVGYIFYPGHSAVLGMGLGQILSNITEALRTAQRRALEAAYLANHPVGLKKAGLTIRDDARTMRPGEWMDVDAPTENVQDSFALFPFKGPDQGLIALFEKMEANGKELGGLATMNISELVKQNTPVGTVLALLEEDSKFMTAVHRRLYNAHRKELQLIQEAMIAAFGDRDMPFGMGDTLLAGDLELVEVYPAMHPMYASRQRQIMQAEAMLAVAERASSVVDVRTAVLEYYRVIGVDEPERFLLPLPEEAQPADMITEYMRVMRGEPIVAGLAQDHDSHVAGHLAQLQMISTGKMPVEQAQQAIPILQAHVAEHLALQMAIAVAAMIGLDPAMLEEGIPPEVEARVAPMVAQAMQMVAQMQTQPSDADLKLQVEQLKAQTQMQLQQLKAQTELEKERLRMEQVKLKEQSQTRRNDDDNETALEIEQMRQIAKLKGEVPKRQGIPSASVSVSTGAPSNNKDQNPGPK